LTSSTISETAKLRGLQPVRDGAVFVNLNGKAVKRTVKTGGTTSQGVRI